MNFEIENGTLIRYIGNDKEVIIPKDVKEIDAQAFFDTDAEKIIIPDGVECDVNAYAFEHCEGLKYVYFGSNVKISQGYYVNGDLYDGADTIFYWCDDLEQIEVSPDNPYISSEGGKLYNKDKTKLLFDPDDKYWEEEDLDMNKEYNVKDGVFNFSFTEIVVRKNGDPRIDAMNKKFCKETLAFMKNCKKDYKDYICGLTQIMAQQLTKEKNNGEIMYNGGIMYSYEKHKSETSIKCYMDNDMLMDIVGSNLLSLSMEKAEKSGYHEGILNMSDMPNELMSNIAEKRINEFFEIIGKPMVTSEGTGYALDEKLFEDMISPDSESRFENIEKVLSQKHIYRYIKALDVFDEAREYFENRVDYYFETGVDYYNVLNAAANTFSEKFKNDAISVRTVIFKDGYALILPGRDGLREELVIDKSDLNDELSKKWYVNLREISILPFGAHDEENDITVSMPCELVLTFNSFYFPLEEVLKGIDKICKFYEANCEMAEKAGLDVEKLPVKYRPHIYLNGKMQEVDNLMLLSDDFKLIEVPLSPIGTDAPIAFTRYYWSEE